MEEIAPGLVDYSAFHDGIGMTVHSHYACESGVLIDPMAPDAPLPTTPQLVVLTNRHHLRHATEFGCPIRCHEAGLHEFEGSGVHVDGFAWGEELAPGVRALEVGVLCPEESALHVAVGMAGLDTPAGTYRIQDKQVDPAWHVPNSPWAGSLAGQVIPGGAPDNPLKARWMGVANGVGIHGTAEDWSIGSRASHGCIRMHVSDVIDLYPRVSVGTLVLIK